jgi:hypothetical protein
MGEHHGPFGIKIIQPGTNVVLPAGISLGENAGNGGM